jgi:transcriptional regulator of acetoin/glycerol metabolism
VSARVDVGLPTAEGNLRAALERHGGSLLRLSREIRISRQAIWVQVRKLGLQAHVRGLVLAQRVARREAKRVAAAEARAGAERVPRNAVERACEGGRFTAEEYLRDLLARHHGVVRAAARELGVVETTLWKRLRAGGLVDVARELRAASRATFEFGIG